MINTIILIYFLIVLGIGFYSRFQIKTPTDYYIAGKNGGLFQVSGSLLATILGGSAILGTLELSQQNGWAAIWFLLCASIGLFILAPISKYVSRYGQFTLPGLLGSFFGKKAQLISSGIITIAWVGIIAAQIIGSAKILKSIGLLGYHEAAILSGVVFIIYTLVGGQKSILKTDLFQSALILIGIIFLFFTIRGEQIPTQVNQLNHKGLFHQDFTFFDLVILFLTYSTTFIVGPDIYSRIFCAKSEKTASRSVLFTAALLIPFAYIITSIGISSQSVETGSTGLGIILMGNMYLPNWAMGLLIAALLSAVMSSADTTLLTASIIGSNMIYRDLNTQKAFYSTKLIIILLGMTSIIIALFVTSIIQMLLLALSFFSGAFIVPTIAGLFKLKIRTGNIVLAMICGGVVALVGKLTTIYSDNLIGNIIIIMAYIVNGLIIFFPTRINKAP